MKNVWLLTKRELNSLFLHSIIAPVILFIFYELSGFFFYTYIAAAQTAVATRRELARGERVEAVMGVI